MQRHCVKGRVMSVCLSVCVQLEQTRYVSSRDCKREVSSSFSSLVFLCFIIACPPCCCHAQLEQRIPQIQGVRLLRPVFLMPSSLSFFLISFLSFSSFLSLFVCLLIHDERMSDSCIAAHCVTGLKSRQEERLYAEAGTTADLTRSIQVCLPPMHSSSSSPRGLQIISIYLFLIYLSVQIDSRFSPLSSRLFYARTKSGSRCVC